MTTPSRLYRFLNEVRAYMRVTSKRDLSPRDRHVFWFVASYMDPVTLACWPSYKTISEGTGLSVGSAMNAVRSVEAHQIWTMTPGSQGRGKATRYAGRLGFSQETSTEPKFSGDPKSSGSSVTKTSTEPKRSVKEQAGPSARAALGAASPTARQIDLSHQIEAMREAASDSEGAAADAWLALQMAWPASAATPRQIHTGEANWTEDQLDQIEAVLATITEEMQ